MKDVTTLKKSPVYGYVKWTIIIIVVIAIVVVVAKIVKAAKASAAVIGEKIGDEITSSQTGVPVPRIKICRSVAADCESAITRVPFIGTKVWVTDDTIVEALNRLVSSEEAVLTSQFFKEISGEGLKSVVEGGFMVENSRKKITYRNDLV